MAWHFGVPVPKGRPLALAKRDAKREAEQHERAVFAEVDARDQKRCRCCLRRGNPNAVGTLGRVHRHHIEYRSKGGETTAANLVSLCHICHALVHAGQLWITGHDANKVITFEIHEAAVLDVFGSQVVPRWVRIVTGRR